MVKDGIIDEPKVTVTTSPECNAQKLVYKVFSAAHLPETAVGL